jgi:hypothetical protein
MAIYDPSGTQVAAFTGTGSREFSVAITGTYVVSVRANNLVTVGTYDVTLSCF